MWISAETLVNILSRAQGGSALFDGKADTVWESEAKSGAVKESADIDLGQILILTKLNIVSAADSFPDSFSVQASSDRKIWTHLVEEKKFKAEKFQTYSWALDAVNARYLKLECSAAKTGESPYSVKISGISVFESAVDDDHAHSNSGNPPHASIFQGGLVRLAKDGEDTKGAAVQANDRRLRDGSILFKGIVQLAGNNETGEGLALQSSDDRIRPATETRAGIVRLGYDGERKSGAAVQGNDSRLRESTENSSGIVRLCPDGTYSETGVVRGNDSRLNNATTSSTGIVRLADDGETDANCAVQGNDRRLRDASTSAKGIVELAEDGESKEGTAVQG
ncbi:MAG: discoidin domain-containing protein, partial [Spirochaetota bacterium]